MLKFHFSSSVHCSVGFLSVSSQLPTHSFSWDCWDLSVRKFRATFRHKRLKITWDFFVCYKKLKTELFKPGYLPTYTIIIFDTMMLFFRMLSGHANPCLKVFQHALLFLFLFPRFSMKLNRFCVSALHISSRSVGMFHFQSPPKGLWVE